MQKNILKAIIFVVTSCTHCIANAGLINLVAADQNNYCGVVDSNISESCSLYDSSNNLSTHARADIATGELGLFSGNIGATNVAHAELEETLIFTLDEGVETAIVKFQMQVFGEFIYVGGVGAWAQLGISHYGYNQDQMIFGDGTGDVLPFTNGKMLEVEITMDNSISSYEVGLYSSLYCANSGGYNECDLANTSHLNIVTEGVSWVASDETFLTKSTFGGQKPIGVPEPSTLAIFALGMIGLASRRFKKQS